MKDPIRNESYAFSICIVKLAQYLQGEKKNLCLAQVLKSGTAIGALIQESELGQSKAGFINKLSISLKEANETEYWVSILKDINFIDQKKIEILQSDCKELIAMLVSSIKTAGK